MRYAVELPGEDKNTGFHERVLGLLGEIHPHQYPVVEVPGTTFHLITQAVRMPTLAAMGAVIPGWHEPALLGPYTDEDPDHTELVRPRHVQLVPGRYAAMLIHRHGVSPKQQAYLELSGAIAADRVTEACADVLTWLRTACTSRGEAGPQNLASGALDLFTPVH